MSTLDQDELIHLRRVYSAASDLFRAQAQHDFAAQNGGVDHLKAELKARVRDAERFYADAPDIP